MAIILRVSGWELHANTSISIILCHVYESVEPDLTDVGCDESILIRVPIHMVLALNHAK